MTTDIELLKAAAKAAGIDAEWHYGCGDALHMTAPDATNIYWNPLINDGDALRLAIKLGLTVATFGMGPYVSDNRGRIIAAAPECSADELAHVVRRQIVRAAAAIGGGQLPMAVLAPRWQE